jgi:hypothetical protein
MKTVEKGRIYNSVTGKSYPIYGREPEPGDKPIRGLWHRDKKTKKAKKE